jgi:wyosine [tRNA(Phe)-imidazoG37] synthetase (radical SAM superfamily)
LHRRCEGVLFELAFVEGQKPDMVDSTRLFTVHDRQWRENLYVYPVISRRSRGLSIGVNLSPAKECTFDCVYCSVDRHMPGAQRHVDVDRLRRELARLLTLARSGRIFADPPFDETPAELRRLNDVAFSGDGEPTASPHFFDAMQTAARLLAERGGSARLVVITNASLLNRPRVEEALAFLDGARGELWAKLDAGTEAHYRRVNRSQVPFQRILENLLRAGRSRPLVIQSMFSRLQGDGPSEEELAAYLENLRRLLADGCRIDRVQVYTAARRTALSSVAPLDAASLEAIAARVRALGLAAESFPGPA